MSIASAVIAVRFDVTLTLTCVPLFESPSPASNEPAPENCVQVIPVVPTVIVPSVEITKPESKLTVPASTKVNVPLVSSPVSAVPFASEEREAAPEATAT